MDKTKKFVEKKKGEKEVVKGTQVFTYLILMKRGEKVVVGHSIVPLDDAQLSMCCTS